MVRARYSVYDAADETKETMIKSKVEIFLYEQGFKLTYDGCQNVWKHPDRQVVVTIVSGIWQTDVNGRLLRGSHMHERFLEAIKM